jgi:hypothetical protein
MKFRVHTAFGATDQAPETPFNPKARSRAVRDPFRKINSIDLAASSMPEQAGIDKETLDHSSGLNVDLSYRPALTVTSRRSC